MRGVCGIDVIGVTGGNPVGAGVVGSALALRGVPGGNVGACPAGCPDRICAGGGVLVLTG